MNLHPSLAETLGVPTPVDADEPVAGVDACPALATILDSMKIVDRQIATTIRMLGLVQTSGEVEAETGVALEQWLSQNGRATRSDRRMLQTAATVLGTMPATLDAFEAGRLSWSQVRIIVLDVRRLPTTLWPQIDDALIGDLDLWELASPDDLPARLAHAIASLLPEQEERDEQAATRDRFLSIQPSLTDEYHGRLYGEGPNSALTAIADTLDSLIPPPSSSPRPGVGADVDPHHEAVTTQGRRRFDALLWLCLRSNDVTSLTGGRLRATAETIRRLAEAGGSLRLLVTDDHGDVIGIGRRSRVAPDWLRDAVTTMFPTSIAPSSRAPAKHCDLDHHQEWDADDGRTDLSNLAPVDRQFHTAKTRGDWTVRASPDGTRIVEHPASGWQQTIIPSTRRFDLTPAAGSDPPA